VEASRSAFASPADSGFWVQGSGFRVQGSGFRILGLMMELECHLAFRVRTLWLMGLRFEGSGFLKLF